MKKIEKMRIHFVGVGGSGISGVYKISKKLGFKVSGCDSDKKSTYIENFIVGHDPKHLDDCDLAVTSPSLLFSDVKNPEIKKAEKMKILLTWQEFVGKYLQKEKEVICIAGTHGKSTTTAMVGTLLSDNGFDPTVIIGANVPAWGSNFRFGNGKYLIIEADEFNDNFLNYKPEIIILNNIEFDHPDYFKSMEQVYESFSLFVRNLTGRKILIANVDSPGVKKLLTAVNKEKINVIKYSSKTSKKIELKVPGKHNFSNALGVVSLGEVLGIKKGNILKSIKNFSGIGRRMELIKNKNGIEVYDDYAHHPTAIKVTLEGLRESHPKAKIVAVVEPHGYKRTEALLSEYGGVFDNVDSVIIGPIFKARDKVNKLITPEKIAEISGHPDAIALTSLKEIVESCKLKIKNSNYVVIIVMGAGKSYLWAREIANIKI